jgi:hypothetical protein
MADRHARVEASEPADDFLAGNGCIAQLAMLLGALACGKDACGD